MSDDNESENTNERNSSETKSDTRGLSQLNRYFDALADPRRRRALCYLSNQPSEPVGVETVARHVKAFEVEYAPNTLVEADYAAVQQELFHIHLPKLDDYGIIDFDSRSETVRFQPSSRIFVVFLWMSHLIERPTKGTV